MPDEIKPGDVVQLKSGGPEMTVDYVVPRSSDQVTVVGCVWFDGVRPVTHDFKVHTLGHLPARGPNQF